MDVSAVSVRRYRFGIRRLSTNPKEMSFRRSPQHFLDDPRRVVTIVLTQYQVCLLILANMFSVPLSRFEAIWCWDNLRDQGPVFWRIKKASRFKRIETLSNDVGCFLVRLATASTGHKTKASQS